MLRFTLGSGLEQARRCLGLAIATACVNARGAAASRTKLGTERFSDGLRTT